MHSLDVGEGTGISGWNLYVYDSDFVRCPEYLGSFPYRGTLFPQAVWRPCLGLPAPHCWPATPTICSFGMAKNGFWERLMKEACCEMPPSDVQKRYASSLQQGR